MKCESCASFVKLKDWAICEKKDLRMTSSHTVDDCKYFKRIPYKREKNKKVNYEL